VVQIDLHNDVRQRLVDWPRYQLRSLVRGFRTPAVSDVPWLAPEVIDLLETNLTQDSVYLEYGAGGSTLFAVKRAGRVISVETDRQWLRAVTSSMTAAEAANCESIGVDIGATKGLGYPIISSPTSSRLRKWRSYVEAPWNSHREHVDLVLIDGRFRVACTVRTLTRVADGTLIVLDDFNEDWRGYDAIFPHVTDPIFVGGAIVFRRKPDLDRVSAERLIVEYTKDPR
jgi:hypothetical protein